jgi:predicted Ser/Thr protein kinase
MTHDDPNRLRDQDPAGEAETVVPRDDAEGAELLEVGLQSEPSGDAAMVSIADARARFPELDVLEILGQGGMGVVYKARQRTLDRLVALKILPTDLSTDPLFAERFQREARALARLQHPHIVGVYEVGEREGLHFLLMEYVDGVNLRQLMNTNSVSPSEALAIVPQICDALHYAHSQGVVHRDIKPENVLLDRGGKVKVADFGLAKLAARGPGDMTLTGTGQVMGTLHYMAPEQYKTPNDVDHRADIFSLGVVFYEMLTGELPVGRFQKPTEGLDIDKRLDEIVMRALERERELRFQSADDVKTEVGALGESGLRPDRGHRARHAKRRARRHGGSLMREMGRTTQAVMGGPSGDNRTLHPLAFASVALFLLSGAATYAVVATIRSRATEPSYATTPYSAGMTAAMIGFSITALLAAFSAWWIRPRQAEFRGARRSAVVVVLAVIVGIATIHELGSSAASVRAAKGNEGRDTASTTVVGRPWREPKPPVPAPVKDDPTPRLGRPQFSDPLPHVTAPVNEEQREAIARDVADLWKRYYQHAWTGDPLGPTQMLVLEEDLYGFQGAGGAFAGRRGGTQRELLPFMSKERLGVPPWSLKLVEVEIDEWVQTGTATAQTRSGTPITTITFPIRRGKGRWWLAAGVVKIETTATAEDDGD